MERIELWDIRLMDVLADHQARAFAWGRFDCATLFADAVQAVTGEDPLEAERNRWTTKRGAARLLTGTGCRTVADWVAERFDEIVPADARRGDVGYAAENDALGFPAIICGAVAMSRDENGWIVLPRAKLVRCYKVG